MRKSRSLTATGMALGTGGPQRYYTTDYSYTVSTKCRNGPLDIFLGGDGWAITPPKINKAL